MSYDSYDMTIGDHDELFGGLRNPTQLSVLFYGARVWGK